MIIFLKYKQMSTAQMFYKAYQGNVPLDSFCRKVGLSESDARALFAADGIDLTTKQRDSELDRRTAFGKWR
jgi:hypothetical protein